MILFCCASELGPPEDLSAIEVILYYIIIIGLITLVDMGFPLNIYLGNTPMFAYDPSTFQYPFRRR